MSPSHRLPEGAAQTALTNYRKAGEAYLCEIDVRPIRGPDGQPTAFIAFEREVVRRRGRPSQGGAGRYRPLGETASEPLSLYGEPGMFT